MTNKYYDVVHFIKTIVKGKNVSLTTDAWALIAKEGIWLCVMSQLVTHLLHHTDKNKISVLHVLKVVQSPEITFDTLPSKIY